MCFIILPLSPFLFTQITIYTSYLLLSAFNPVLINNILTIHGINFEFVDACIASLAYSLIFVLVMLTKDMSLMKRILVVISGWVLIFIMNVSRIVILATVAVTKGLDLFHTLDLIIWFVLSGVFVALVWITLVWFYDVRSIPVYDDIKELYRKTYFSK